MGDFKWTHEKFLQELLKRNTYYLNKQFTVIGVYKKVKEDILVKDKYGLHKISCERLLKNQPLSARTSLNLREYFYKYFTEKIKNFDINNEDFLDVKNIKSVFVCEVKSKYGVCLISTQNILKGVRPTIKSAINKTEYFIKQLQEKFGEIITDYSLIEYKSAKDSVTFKTEFGLCESTPNSLLSYRFKKIGIDSAVDKSEYLKNIIIKERGDIYDLTDVFYTNNTTPVKIGCIEHGMFEVVPANFIGTKKHRGCSFCGRKSTTKYNIENPSGWSYSSWEKSSLKSKNFDSFKVYIIKCWNDEEEFFKIGRTFLKVDKRFRSKKMPYEYSVESIFTHESGKLICELEQKLKNSNSKHKYLPNMHFEGMHECFIKLEDITAYINLIKDKIKTEQV